MLLGPILEQFPNNKLSTIKGGIKYIRFLKNYTIKIKKHKIMKTNDNSNRIL